jgi:hypothetical protein
MRYEVYGVLSTSGYNVTLGYYPSFTKASKTIQNIDLTVYPLFAIVEKHRQCSSPITIWSGQTLKRKVDRVKSFLTGEDPMLNQQQGIKFWEQYKQNK